MIGFITVIARILVLVPVAAWFVNWIWNLDEEGKKND